MLSWNRPGNYCRVSRVASHWLGENATLADHFNPQGERMRAAMDGNRQLRLLPVSGYQAASDGRPGGRSLSYRWGDWFHQSPGSDLRRRGTPRPFIALERWD